MNDMLTVTNASPDQIQVGEIVVVTRLVGEEGGWGRGSGKWSLIILR